jgi:UDP-glucuronate decarboxylase
MKVLITGGAGFLGSNLSDKFIAENHNVTVIDDLSTGSTKNIEHLLENLNFKFINHDVRNPFEVDVDLILNFACPASPIHYQSDPVKTISKYAPLGPKQKSKVGSSFYERGLR